MTFGRSLVCCLLYSLYMCAVGEHVSRSVGEIAAAERSQEISTQPKNYLTRTLT